MTEQTGLWSAQDVADYLGVPLATLYVWRTRGKGPSAHRIGKYLRFDPADVAAWVEQQREPQRTPAA